MLPVTNIIKTAVLATALVSAPSAQATMCMSGDEVAAEQIRRMQTTLMVGSMKCAYLTDYQLGVKYNRFIDTHASSIKAHNKVLKSYFKRKDGAEYRRVMDSYITNMANAVSMAAHNDPYFCVKVAELADNINLGTSDLTSVARLNRVIPSDFPSCIGEAQLTTQHVEN